MEVAPTNLICQELEEGESDGISVAMLKHKFYVITLLYSELFFQVSRVSQKEDFYLIGAYKFDIHHQRDGFTDFYIEQIKPFLTEYHQKCECQEMFWVEGEVNIEIIRRGFTRMASDISSIIGKVITLDNRDCLMVALETWNQTCRYQSYFTKLFE